MEKKKTGRPTDARKSYRESFRFSEEDGGRLKPQKIQLVSSLYESEITGKTSYHTVLRREEVKEPPKDIICSSTDEGIKYQG